MRLKGEVTPGAAGQIFGAVAGVDYSTHEVAAYLYVEGVGWSAPNHPEPWWPVEQYGSHSYRESRLRHVCVPNE